MRKVIKSALAKFEQYRILREWDRRYAKGDLPWYTYPAIEYLEQLDLMNCNVFEYGSGNSTRYWRHRCKMLASVEDNKKWFQKWFRDTSCRGIYNFCPEKEKYVNFIHQHTEKFDVIIIDGSHRYECAIEALKMLSHNGFIILDNSDWKELTSRLLREAGLFEVDMSGFGPLNGYTWTTSFYFRRDVRLLPAHKEQPIHGIGSIKHKECKEQET